MWHVTFENVWLSHVSFAKFLHVICQILIQNSYQKKMLTHYVRDCDIRLIRDYL